MSNRVLNELKERKKQTGGAPWSLTAMTVGLFLITGWRTADFIYRSLPKETFFVIVAAAGVLAFDAGAILWSMAWKNNASNDEQDRVAKVMFVLDVVGMLITSIADTQLYFSGAELPEEFKTAALWGIPAIIVINVVAGVVYDMTSDRVKLARDKRHAAAILDFEREQSEQEASVLDLREQNLIRAEKLAEQRLRLQATEQGLQKAENQGDHVRQAAENVASRVKEHFRTHPQMQNGNGHLQHTLNESVEAVEPKHPNA
ncbi:MAG: hypothetical protein KGJ80_09705 [Chloroflexota bacterium]|nr:hypothetical protein [Chloroflexota bacterium]